ncbi:enzymatic polyprotein [Daphnia sinensis]|uniref:RNA-directed DNA polymerase n=1 Tax=Daphnia sinensis TaxID=1820382 RepID=A0AAD5PT57_9CRUS|nr:enzymatic polyprotein [Daphnia sinensis]
MSRGCRCSSGRCFNCVCVQAGRLCREQCNCSQDTCNNQDIDRFQDPQGATMDLDAFNAALAALATNQQHVLTALAARLLAAPAPAPPPPAVPAANAAPAPVRVVLDPDVRYSGSNEESVNDWLQLVNRKALAENWGDDDKRRAAISSLFGKALTWQEEIGVNILDWDDWLLALRGSFEVRLTEGQWQAMVEARRQLPNEPGSTYVLEKIKICRRRSTPLNDVELIPYLIRGLYHPAHVSVMMGNPPASVNAFLVEIRRLENISEAVAVSPETISPSTGFYDKEKNETAAASESMARAIESLTNQLALLTRMARGTKYSAIIAKATGIFLVTVLSTTRVGPDKKVRETVSSPFIQADVFRIGGLRAMVDSGAKHSAISEETLTDRTAFPIRPPSNYRFLDGSPVDNVVGEISLTVRYQGTIVDLPKVAVLRNMMYPLVLGVEWIVKSGVTIKGVDGRAEVIVPLESEVVSVREKGNLVRDYVETEAESIHVAFQSAAQELLNLGALVSEDFPDEHRRPKGLLKSMRSKRIPANSAGHMKFRVSCQEQELWMAPTAGAAGTTGGWLIPSCVMKSADGVLKVPVMNTSQSALSWKNFRGLFRVVPVEDDEIFALETTSDTRGILGSVQLEEGSPAEPLDNLENVIIDPDLSLKKKGKLMELLYTHRHCLSTRKGETKLVQHVIETGNTKPISCAPYRVSMVERRLINDQVKKMLEGGIIQQSSSPWSSPVVLVKKKSGEIRFCVDYRRLNAVTERDVYPLPRVEDVLGRLTGAKYFSSLDLESGFWQMHVAEPHRPKTAFVTPDGLFEFCRLPFGLCGSPPSFQRLMDKVLDGLKWTECMCYMDDILVFGSTFDGHLERLDKVLTAINKAGLVLNVKKCLFGAKKIVHLGHVVSREGISPDPAKVTAITKFPRPLNATQLRAFLGLAAYYRSFVRGFADTARPLHCLLKKNADVKNDWTNVHDGAMQELKEKITTAPVLHVSGAANVVADALSRSPVGPAEETDPVEHLLAALQPEGYTRREIGSLQHTDEDIRELVMAIQGFADWPSLIPSSDFTQYKGVLYKKNEKRGRSLLLVVPSILRKEIIAECHDAADGGHRGFEKTLDRVGQRFWWKGMSASVRSYVRSCHFCQTYKSRTGFRAGKLRPIPPPKSMFHTLGVDHLGPFKLTIEGKQHLIVCIDYLSRWVEVEPVVSTGVEEVMAFLERVVFLRHGPPFRIVSDKGPCFTSLAFAEFCREWRIRHVQASAEHPETNGLVEKMNGSIASTLAAYVNFNHTDWDKKIARATFCINTAKQSSTEISPFELVYGRTAVMVVELAFPWPPDEHPSNDDRVKAVTRWRETARKLVIKRQHKAKENYDRYRKPDPIFRPGELVLIARKPKTKGKTKKFVPRFIGPYQIYKRVAATCYAVEDLPCNRKRRLWRRFNAHSSQIRRYFPRKETDWLPSVDEGDYEDVTDEDGDPKDFVEAEKTTKDPTHIHSDEQEVRSEPCSVTVGSAEPQVQSGISMSRAGRIIRPKRKEAFVYY